jgi:hypothetical protein
VALAASLGWYGRSNPEVVQAPFPFRRVFPVLFYVMEGLQKGCLVLAPLILSRHVRDGGTLRPAEFLALCLGLPLLVPALDRPLGLDVVIPIPGRPAYAIRSMEAFRLSMLVRLGIAVSAGVWAAARRRRGPAWLTGVLLVVAWTEVLTTVVFFTVGVLNGLLRSGNWPAWLQYRVQVPLVRCPSLLQVLVPLSATVIGLRKPGRTWVEWAALGLAAGRS